MLIINRMLQESNNSHAIYPHSPISASSLLLDIKMLAILKILKKKHRSDTVAYSYITPKPDKQTNDSRHCLKCDVDEILHKFTPISVSKCIQCEQFTTEQKIKYRYN